jgi:hypothetical protein
MTGFRLGLRLAGDPHRLKPSNEMQTLKTAVVIAWIAFWAFWLLSAFRAKKGRGARRRIPLNGLSALAVILLLRVFRGGSLAVRAGDLGSRPSRAQLGDADEPEG